MKTNLHVGVSNASVLIPAAYLPGIASRMVSGIAADFWQCVPVRPKALRALPSIVHEGTWKEIVVISPGMENFLLGEKVFYDEIPDLKHVIVFPSAKNCLRWMRQRVESGSLPITHWMDGMENSSERTMYEVSPKIGESVYAQTSNWSVTQLLLKKGAYLKGRRGYQGVVYDTCHSREDPSLGLAEDEFIIDIAPYVGVIHLQPLRGDSGREWRRFLAGEPTRLAEIIALLLQHGANPCIVLEIPWSEMFGAPRFLSLSPRRVVGDLNACKKQVVKQFGALATQEFVLPQPRQTR